MNYVEDVMFHVFFIIEVLHKQIIIIYTSKLYMTYGFTVSCALNFILIGEDNKQLYMTYGLTVSCALNLILLGEDHKQQRRYAEVGL